MSNELLSKLGASGAIAVVVGAAAAVTNISIVVVVIAMLAAVGAFWALDAWIAPEAPAVDLAPGVERSRLPITSTEPLAPPAEEDPPAAEPPATPAPAEASEAGDDAGAVQQSARLDPALFDPQSVEVKVSSRSSRRAFSVRIAKHGNSLAECEDAVTLDPRRSIVAVADGASSSFGAHLWADTLSKQFVRQPPKPLSVSAFATWLDEARTSSGVPEGEDKGEAGSAPAGWWSEDGVRTGAYSTIVGAVVTSDGDGHAVTVMCLGDSCAFVLTGQAGERVMRRSLPYEDASQFGSHPSLLGSLADRIHDEPTWTTVPVGGGDLVVLASDAVAEWLLGDPRRFSLFDSETPDAIAARLVADRADGLIVNDDVAVAVLELSNRGDKR